MLLRHFLFLASGEAKNLTSARSHLVSICQFVIKTLSKNQNLASIKGRNPVSNLQKKTTTMVYITNVDLVNDNEYTKFNLTDNTDVLKILSKNQILT